MKSLLTLLLFMSVAHAAPVLNVNMAAEGTLVTIWPDHKNPDHFYFAPNFMTIAFNKNLEPEFNMVQYQTGNCGRIGRRLGKCISHAMMSAQFIAGYEHQQLLEAQAGIKKLRPQARFSAIPFMGSKVDFGDILSEFVTKELCSPLAGQAADKIPCHLVLNRRGMEELIPFLNDGSVISFQLVYEIAGVIDVGGGVYEEDVLKYGLSVNLGGEMLAKHPSLDKPFVWEE